MNMVECLIGLALVSLLATATLGAERVQHQSRLRITDERMNRELNAQLLPWLSNRLEEQSPRVEFHQLSTNGQLRDCSYTAAASCRLDAALSTQLGSPRAWVCSVSWQTCRKRSNSTATTEITEATVWVG